MSNRCVCNPKSRAKEIIEYLFASRSGFDRGQVDCQWGLELKTHFAYRAGRTLLVAAIVLFLATSLALAGDQEAKKGDKTQRTLVVIINTSPLKVSDLSVEQGKESKNVSYMLIQTGVELFKRSLRWLKKDGSKKDTWILFFRSG